jgi:hypothetical protein
MLLDNMYIKIGNILRCAASARILLMWGELPFGAVQLFRHTVHIAKGTTLPKGCLHIELCSISLIFSLYSKIFGAQMGAGERVEFHAATEHGQNRLYRLRHLPLC